jgi:hypothetical protein
MSSHTRYGFKWSVNEVLSLQREFELLGWSIDQISEKHKRTPNAIMYKLDQEGFADYNVLYSNYHDLNAPIPVEKKTDDIWIEYNDSEDDESPVDDDDEEYVENADGKDDSDEEDNCISDLSERVYGLEESVSEIRDMIKQMMSTFRKSSTSKTWF